MEAAGSRRSYHCGVGIALGALAVTRTVATVTGNCLAVAGFPKTVDLAPYRYLGLLDLPQQSFAVC